MATTGALTAAANDSVGLLVPAAINPTVLARPRERDGGGTAAEC